MPVSTVSHRSRAVSEDDFHQHFNINVLGVLLVTQEAIKHFGPDGGSIINLSTTVTRNPPAWSFLVRRFEERHRSNDAGAGEGTRPAKNPGECD